MVLMRFLGSGRRVVSLATGPREVGPGDVVEMSESEADGCACVNDGRLDGEWARLAGPPFKEDAPAPAVAPEAPAPMIPLEAAATPEESPAVAEIPQFQPFFPEGNAPGPAGEEV